MSDMKLYSDAGYNCHFDTKAYDDAWKAFKYLKLHPPSNGQFRLIPHSEVYD